MEVVELGVDEAHHHATIAIVVQGLVHHLQDVAPSNPVVVLLATPVVVHLTGTAKSEAERRQAVELARAVPDVKGVQDDM